MCCIPHGLGLTKKVEKLIFTPPLQVSVEGVDVKSSFFLVSPSLVTIDFWHTFMGSFSSRCSISFSSLLNSFRLAAQSFSARC